MPSATKNKSNAINEDTGIYLTTVKSIDTETPKIVDSKEAESKKDPASQENGGTHVDVITENKTIDNDDDNSYDDRDGCVIFVEKIENAVDDFYDKHKDRIFLAIKIFLFVLYLTYFIYCVQYRYFDEGSYVLTAITAGLIWKIINTRVLSTFAPYVRKCLVAYGTNPDLKRFRKFVRYGLWVAALVALSVYLGVDVLQDNPQNAQALLGIAVLILVCYVTSAKPSRVNWHPVFWGFVVQILFATLTLRTVFGYQAFKWVGDLVHDFVGLSQKGSAFVFGDYFRAREMDPGFNIGFFLDSAGVIVFFNAFIFMLDYWGILEFIVLKIGRALALCMETGPVESVVAAANIFIGLTEAPLLVRPFLPIVTRSEIHAILTCGFASVSGAFLAMFISAGAPPNHLLTAAVISAPASLAISKLMYPETERVDYASQRNISTGAHEDQKNVLHACSDGAAFSIRLVSSIMVNMIAFVSLFNLVDTLLVWIGDRAGVDNMNFEFISSYLLYPISYMMGAPAADCQRLASLIGVKMIATPFVAYKHLGHMIRNRPIWEAYQAQGNGTWHWSGSDVILDATNDTLPYGVMSERSEIIATYALLGLSAFPAFGFSMGSLIPMCPARKPDVVHTVMRAFVAGNLANLATGAVAGVMFTSASQ